MQVVSALKAAAKSGVVTHVTMTDDSSYSSNFSKLEAAGVDVHLYPDNSTRSTSMPRSSSPMQGPCRKKRS